MTSELGSAQIPIRATLDKLDQDLDAAHSKVEGKLGKIAKSAGKLVGGAVLGGIGLVVGGIAAIGGAAHGAAKEVDDAYDTIRIGTGATGDQLAGLQSSFNTVYGNFSGEASVVSEVITALNSKLGATDDVLVALATPLADVTRMLGGDAATNANTFARTLGDWDVPAEKGAELLDKIFVATQKSGIGFDRLNQLMVQFGAPLRNMGFTVDDSIALLSKWEKEGVNTELVMGSLRIASGKFAKAGKPLRESLLATFETIQNTTDSSAALAIGMEVFGARAGPDMTAAIREGRFAIDDMVAMMGDAEGAIEDASRATEDWPEKFQRAKNKVILALSPIGDAVMGTIGKAFDSLEPMLEGFGPWIEKNVVPGVEKLGSAAGVFFDDIAAGKGPVEGFKDVLWTLLPPGLAADLTGAIEWVQQLVADAKAGDWSAVGGAIWEQVQTAFNKAIAWGGDTIAKLAEKLSGALEIEPTYTFTPQGLVKSNVWMDIGKEIMALLWDGLKQAASWGLTALTDALTIMAGKLDTATESVDFEAAGYSIADKVISTVAGWFTTDEATEKSKNVLWELTKALARASVSVFNAQNEASTSIAMGIIDRVGVEFSSEDSKSRMRDIIEQLVIATAPPLSLQWFVGKGVTAFESGKALWEEVFPPASNARGTDYWRGGPTWVGEEGPEIVVPPQGSQVLSNAESQQAGSTYNIVQNFYGPADAKDVEIGVLRGLRGLGVPVGV